VDSEKRRKMMLVTAAVFSFGAGSYWFFGRDTDTGHPDALDEGDVARKPRVEAEASPPPRKPAPDRPSEEGVTAPTRKVREEAEDTNPGRKPRPRDDRREPRKPIRRAA